MTAQISRPPRISPTNPPEALASYQKWLSDLYQVLELEQQIVTRLEQVKKIVAETGWPSPTGYMELRTSDYSSVSLDDVANLLATLIADLKGKGIL